MLKYLRNNNFSSLFLSFFIFLLLLLPDFHNISSSGVENFPSILNYFFSIINSNFYLSFILALLVNILLGYFIVSLNEAYNFLQIRNYLPLFFFFILCSINISTHFFSPVHISIIIFLFIIHKILYSFNIKNFTTIFFDLGIITGILFYIYYPSLVFILYIFLGILIFRPSNWREYLTNIIGIFIPVSIYETYRLVFNINIDNTFNKISQIFYYSKSINELLSSTTIEKIYIIFFIFILLLSIIKTIKTVNAFKIFHRKIISYFLILILLNLILMILIPDSYDFFSFIALIPASYFLSFYFSTKNVFINLLFIIFIIFTFIIRFQKFFL